MSYAVYSVLYSTVKYTLSYCPIPVLLDLQKLAHLLFDVIQVFIIHRNVSYKNLRSENYYSTVLYTE